MMYIVISEEYASSATCQSILKHIKILHSKNKHISIQQIQDPDEIQNAEPKSVLLILGYDIPWIKYLITKVQRHNLYPILLSDIVLNGPAYPYCTISMDIPSSIHTALNHLHSAGLRATALYGVNRFSPTDQQRLQCFQELLGAEAAVFYNDGDLTATFHSFQKRIGQFDSVICVHDYIALSLITHLKSEASAAYEHLSIMSFGNSPLLDLVSPKITAISSTLGMGKEVAQAVFSLYNFLQATENVSSIKVQLKGQLTMRETTSEQPLLAASQEPEPFYVNEKSAFYNEPEIIQISTIDQMIHNFDETDYRILHCLLQDFSYARISESCFISETAAKYRVKKMLSSCNVQSRQELLKILRKFI